MKKLIIPVMLTSFLNGCSTIYFDNGAVSSDVTTQEKWHHNILFALIEVSDPVNLKNECGNSDWSSVKTELTFLNGLTSFIPNLIVPLWSPKTVEVSCKY